MGCGVKKLTYVGKWHMNTERFVARDSKSALEKVKAKLGADALIISTVRSDAGVEISAINGNEVAAGASRNLDNPSEKSVNDITLGYLDRELKALREVLYNALGERAWQEMAGKKPVLSAIEQRLFTLGLSKFGISAITSNIDASVGLNDAWSGVLSNLTSAVDVAGDAATNLGPAPKAIVGGTGNCRSLICRQLITKCLQTSKPSQILLISVTQDPSGALIDFCKREKVKRIHVNSMLEARQYLLRSGRRKKVIIETPDLMPSLGINDPIFDLFNDHELGIEVISVLPATHQAEILKSIDQHIKHLPISGAIISRISDAVSLGAILDVLILTEIPLVGVSRQSESALQQITSNGLIRLAKKLVRERVDENRLVSGSSGYSKIA
jgi:flagellar biosynthesis protein FlhF